MPFAPRLARRTFLAAAVASAAGVRAAAPDLAALLEAQVTAAQGGIANVAGVIGNGGRHVAAAGRFDRDDARAPDGDTVFEMGSVAKVFTALLLADMAQRGELNADDPVSFYLPNLAAPSLKGVTLSHLAGYFSGFAEMPDNLKPADRANPLADFSLTQLYAHLAAFNRVVPSGEEYGYSNVAFGLLAHALSRRADMSYDDLVVARICTPLGLTDTRATLTKALRERIAPGHDFLLRRTPVWTLGPALAGSGGLYSTANDMLTFLAACTDDSPLRPALAMLVAKPHATDAKGIQVGAGWFITHEGGNQVVWKDGNTVGHSSFIGYAPREGTAAVVLANAASGLAVRMMGQHLLNPAVAAPRFTGQR